MLCRSHDRRFRTTHYRDYAKKVSKAAGRREEREERGATEQARKGSSSDLLFVSPPAARRMDARAGDDGRSEHGDRAVKTSNRGRGRAPPFADLPSLLLSYMQGDPSNR